jgi:hypothetical protein
MVLQVDKHVVRFFIAMTLLVMLGAPLSAEEGDAEQALVTDEQIQEYVAEFVSPMIKQNYPRIYEGLENALSKIPYKVVREITRRARPIIFVPSIQSGIARFANATEFAQEGGKVPAFSEGFYLIILADELNNVEDLGAVEGIIAHEIAHRYLEHLKSPDKGCDLEKEANALVKEWGMEREFNTAKETFGHKHEGDSPCADDEVKE